MQLWGFYRLGLISFLDLFPVQCLNVTLDAKKNRNVKKKFKKQTEAFHESFKIKILK